jgi:polyferredoxin
MYSAPSKFKKYFLKTLGFSILIGTFVLMCIIQLWYTMFILFGAAVILNLLSGKAQYCSTYCPLGTMQEQFFDEKKEYKRRIKKVGLLKPVFIIIFWIIVIFSTYSNMDSEIKLWVYMLRIMVSTFFLALLLQEFFGKRFFCIHLCPLRIPILKHLIKVRRVITKHMSKQPDTR